MNRVCILFRAEGRTNTPRWAQFRAPAPFDFLDHHGRGRIRLYVKRVFTSGDADVFHGIFALSVNSSTLLTCR